MDFFKLNVMQTMCLILLCCLALHRPFVSGTRRDLSRTELQGTFSAEGFLHSADYEHFTPTAPSPENVNCHVEVPTTVSVGGRCVRFGRSQIWTCQSGVHVQISQSCGELMSNVEENNVQSPRDRRQQQRRRRQRRQRRRSRE